MLRKIQAQINSSQKCERCQQDKNHGLLTLGEQIPAIDPFAKRTGKSESSLDLIFGFPVPVTVDR